MFFVFLIGVESPDYGVESVGAVYLELDVIEAFAGMEEW